MGMFDRLWVRCPQCGGEVEGQAKSGPCAMKNYDIYDAPLSILAECANDLYCLQCKVRLCLRVQCMVTVEVAQAGRSQDDDDE